MRLLDVTQGGLERYEAKVLPGFKDEGMSAARFNRLIIEGAVAGGFAEDVPDDLESLAPWQIIEMTGEIKAHVAKAKAPPDPN